MKLLTERLLIALLIIAFAGAYLYFAFRVPVDGDGALHAATVEVMGTQGTLVDHHPYTITEGEELLPIFYPKLFYAFMTAAYVLVGDVTFHAMVPLFGLLIGLFTYLIAKLLFHDFAGAFLAGMIVLSSTGLLSNSVSMFRMETTVVLLAIAMVYALLKFCELRSRRWFAIAVLLFATCIGTKQQSYIYVPIVPLLIFNRLRGSWSKKLFTTLLFLSLSVLIVSPVLIKEFLSTGTFFYPGIPLVGKLEKIIADIIHVRLYTTGAGWMRYGVGSERIANLKETFHQPYNHLVFLNPFDPGSADAVVVNSFYIPLFLLSAVFMVVNHHYFLILFLLLQQILLYIQPLERYFLLNQIIVAIVLGGSLTFFKRRVLRNYYAKIGIILSLTVLSVLSAFYQLDATLMIPHYSYGGYVRGRIAAEQTAGFWLQNHTPHNAVIITPRTHVFSYYAKRRALWLNQLGGKEIYEAFIHNDTDAIHRIGRTYKNSYIVIPLYWIAAGEADGKWISYIEQKTVDGLDANKQSFKRVYSNSLVRIYQPL